MEHNMVHDFRHVVWKVGEAYRQEGFRKNNHLLFLLSGDTEIVYGSRQPRIISGGNMILLTPLSNCVCYAKTPVELVIMEFGDLRDSCDPYIFQDLAPIYSLIKYEFRELVIREPLQVFLESVLAYLHTGLPMKDLSPEKVKELFILLRIFYDPEELVTLFYPLMGKNMDFKKMVTDNYLKGKNATEYAELCGYSLSVFQRKFKEVFGETVYQWLQRQKAEQIKHYLMTTEVNLKEIADKFEFASPAHLNKFCKIWFGMTPTELRQTYLLKKNLR